MIRVLAATVLVAAMGVTDGRLTERDQAAESRGSRLSGLSRTGRAEVPVPAPATPSPRSVSRHVAHFGHPDTWFVKAAPDKNKIVILRSRVKHAADVERFFASHPKQARTLKGRARRWQHRRMGRWAREALRIVLRHEWHTLPAPADWVTAVRVAQRPFPGSAAWLLSCSSAEGSHGAWVTYGSHAYSNGVEYTGIVGGWLQYRWETFKGHYRRALADLRLRGFRVPAPLRDAQNVRAWLSPLAQALAGGWGVLHGQRSHWYASYGRGC